MMRRFLKDRRGASAVEFALIAPAMIVFYFAVAGLGQATMSLTKTGNVASSIGDLASQESTLTESQVSDIFNIGGLLMTPFPSSDLSMRITSLTEDAKGNPKVDWSRTDGMTQLSNGSTQSIPAGLITSGQSIIMAEAAYTFHSPVDDFLPSPPTFTRTYYLRPRKSDHIPAPTP